MFFFSTSLFQQSSQYNSRERLSPNVIYHLPRNLSIISLAYQTYLYTLSIISIDTKHVGISIFYLLEFRSDLKKQRLCHYHFAQLLQNEWHYSFQYLLV